jgi:hypothetical protein
MYYKHLFTTTAALALASTAAFADGPSVSVTELPITATSGQTGFVGGSVGLEYGRATTEYGYKTDFSSQSVSLEYAATPKLAFAIDLENQSTSDDSNVGGTVVTLHGIYTLNSNVKLGAWVARDDTLLRGRGYRGKGIEISYNTDALELQAHWGDWSEMTDPNWADDGPQIGISADYKFGNGFSVNAAMTRANLQSTNYTNWVIGGAYKLSSSLSLFAAAGHYDNDTYYESEKTMAIGVNFDFGPNSGTTFNLREMKNYYHTGP